MKTGVGVKIPRVEFLDPQPLSLSVDVTNSLGFAKQSCEVISHSQSRKKFFKFQRADMGGGQDIQGGVS